MNDQSTQPSYYKGEWKRSIPYRDTDFAVDNLYDEPHAKRKRDILRDYPQITKLYGPSSKTKYIVVCVVILHFIGLYISAKISRSYLFFAHSLLWGGTLTGLSGILIQECCHCLASHRSNVNILLGYLSNIPIIVPVSISFQKYHIDHHIYLGVRNKDPDLPLPIEIKMVEGNTIFKLV